MDPVEAIKERLKQLISAKGLTPAKFADMIGVQRSGISHILSGRNKPSLDVLNKILVNFPDISGDWLITADGEMFKVNKRREEPAGELFPQQQEPDEAVMEPKNVNREEDMPYYGKRNIKEHSETEEKSTVTSVEKEGSRTSSFAGSGKKIEKIVVFYADRTFREYTPD